MIYISPESIFSTITTGHLGNEVDCWNQCSCPPVLRTRSNLVLEWMILEPSELRMILGPIAIRPPCITFRNVSLGQEPQQILHFEMRSGIVFSFAYLSKLFTKSDWINLCKSTQRSTLCLQHSRRLFHLMYTVNGILSAQRNDCIFKEESRPWGLCWEHALAAKAGKIGFFKKYGLCEEAYTRAVHLHGVKKWVYIT